MTQLLAPPLRPLPDVVYDIHRRDILIGAGAALFLAACGGDAQPDAAPPAAPVDGGAFPVTVEHRYGSTTIPSESQRVVTVGLVDHDAVLALGTVPVGITAYEVSTEQRHGVWPWAHDRSMPASSNPANTTPSWKAAAGLAS